LYHERIQGTYLVDISSTDNCEMIHVMNQVTVTSLT